MERKSKFDGRKTTSDDDEYEVQDTFDSLEGSLGTRFAKYVRHFSFRNVLRSSSSNLLPLGKYYITTRDRNYQVWWLFVVVLALWSSLFTPIEFGFFRGLPYALWIVDLGIQILFFADIVVRFFTAYTDPETYRLVVDHRSIAMRYIKSDFILDLLGVLPWDTIYKRCGRKEEVRYLVWVRLYRCRKVDSFFERIEKDIRVNYFLTRIMKLLAVEFYCTHTAACIYYYLATTVPTADQSYTWIGSLTLGDFSYYDFRAIDLGKRYVTSLYWAVLTMATVGYGDVHAVNIREMIFVMIYVSFDMILGAYLIGNMTALIVKGSNTEKFRDKMTTLIKYMNRNGLPRNIRSQMKNHIRLQFENGTMKEADNLLEDFPASVRSKVAQTLYSHIVEEVHIFNGCSPEFLNEIVCRVSEEFFLPGEIVISQGGASDQFYIVCDGSLEETKVGEDGKEYRVNMLAGDDVFGELGMLCNIPQPFSVRVLELCRLLRIDKHEFTDIVEIYFNDGRLVINNLLEKKDTDARVGQLAADVKFLMDKHSAELALMVNNASYYGDLGHLKHLVKEGAVIATADYDGRTPLHLAASKGFELVVLYLIREGADVNAIDKFGVSPLLEAAQGGHDTCLSVLMDKGAHLHLQDEGAYLCKAVKKGNSELLRRLLVAGVNVSAVDYDSRTALHLAAAEGSYGLAKMLIDAGADIHSRDRWGRTALDEAALHQHTSVVALLKDAAHGAAQRAAHKSHLSNNHVEAFHKMSPALRAQKLSFPYKGAGIVSVEFCQDVEQEDKALTGQGRMGSIFIPDEDKASSGQGRKSGTFIPEEDRPSSGQGRKSATFSPYSSDSSKKERWRSAGADRQSSTESRLSLGLSPDHPDRIGDRMHNVMDNEILPVNPRILPSKRGLVEGRPSSVGEPNPFAVRKNKRITIYAYHPWTPAALRAPGKVEFLPSTVEDILSLAQKHFGKVGTKVFNQDAGEISDTDLIVDAERIYVVNEEDILKGGSLI